MQQLIYFFQKYKRFLYFLLLQFIAITLTINNLNFHKSKFISSANIVSGNLINKQSNLRDYFNLKEVNSQLVSENTSLRNQISKLEGLLELKTKIVTDSIDTTKYFQNFTFIAGKIRKNSYKKRHNFITINLGKRNGVQKEMGVFNDKGIIGIVDDISDKYARVQSILNNNSKINIRFKNNYYFGTLAWNAKDYRTVQLTDLPRQAIFSVGDTVITGGRSTIFPEGIPIGTVVNKPNVLTASNTINIKLFNDMSNISNIYVINSFDRQEVKSLEIPNNE